MSEDEIPDPIASFMASVAAQAKQRAKREDRFRTEADSVLHRLRIGVYNITDKVDGPAEPLAFGALKNFRKASRAVVLHLMDVHPDFADLWIESIVSIMKISIAEANRTAAEIKAKEAKKA